MIEQEKDSKLASVPPCELVVPLELKAADETGGDEMLHEKKIGAPLEGELAYHKECGKRDAGQNQMDRGFGMPGEYGH